MNSTVNRMNSMMNVSNSPASNSIVGNIYTNIKNGVNTPLNGPGASINWIYVGLGILFILCIILFTTFYSKIVEVLPSSLTDIFVKNPSPAVLSAPPAPSSVHPETVMEKILPGMKEVFNISSNRYTYADSAPLCKALGAELATYDQVKEAHGRGADWCNYGWVKGQMALYPTQNDTWNKLQQGPQDQRNSCGRPGINGGYFDNPEMRFGVTCYGVKPAQSAHDAAEMASGVSSSPDALAFDQKVAEFKTDIDSIGLMPFREASWSQ